MLTFFVNPIVREAPSRISTGVAKSSLPDLRNSIFSFAAELRFISHRHCQMGLTSFCLAHFFEMFSPQLRRASSLPAPVVQAPRSASAARTLNQAWTWCTAKGHLRLPFPRTSLLSASREGQFQNVRRL